MLRKCDWLVSASAVEVEIKVSLQHCTTSASAYNWQQLQLLGTAGGYWPSLFLPHSM